MFFIDNQSICAALAKGASRAVDLQILCAGFHALAQRLGIRVWVEWIPSHANPADELSRYFYSRFCKVGTLTLPSWVTLGEGRTWRQFLLEVLGGAAKLDRWCRT